MSKSLMIVESPAKAKTIGKYLGKNYIVKSSVGHIRDLPTAGGAKTATVKKKTTTKKTKAKKLTDKQKETQARRKMFDRMAIDPENDWKARYEILPGKEKVLNELKKIAEGVDTIYLATDLDREGEAIAWHLREAIGGDDDRYKRITFSEITKKSILAALDDPGDIDIDRVNAQQTRRFLDRLVGFMISPLLWAKIARGLSAGRVQSVAARIIFEREREIHAFIPDEYWEVYADTLSKQSKDKVIRFNVNKLNDKAFKPVNEEQAMQAVEAVKSSKLIITDRTDKPTKSKPSAPFITSTLQQAASLRLSFGVKKTMMMAQRLYEAGHITYMRTDSTNLSKDAVEDCRQYVEKSFGKKYLPEEPQVYTSKKNAQEAHEAIRPSNVQMTVKELPADTDKDAIRLYELIWSQFVACQMTNAEYDSTNVIIKAQDYDMKARGRVLRFDGYLRVMPSIVKKGDEDLELPDLQIGEELSLQKVDPLQKFTKPPPRFSEASLVKELEKKEIGRPSTYASIITTIQDRGYVRAEGRRFHCLKMGEIVSERLIENFTDLMDYEFTANMNKKLDDIAEGQADWKKLLNTFYADFSKKVDEAKINMRGNDPTLTDIKCPDCGRDMGIRTGRTGVFLGCSGYALPPKERCKQTINLVAGEEVKSIDLDDDEGNVAEIQALRRCDTCGTAMDHYLIDEDRKLHVCGNNPDCAGFHIEKGKFTIKGYDGPVIECDKCGENMELKTGRFGKYFGCNGYPDCKNTRKLMRNGEAAPPRCDPIHMPELLCEKSDGYFILRDGAAGVFLASSAFPKSRETRKPLVEDLVRHKDKLDPKYKHLAKAPEKDPDGNPAIIRFSRKAKVHVIGSDDKETGKATKWSLIYEKNKWIEGKPAEPEGEEKKKKKD